MDIPGHGSWGVLASLAEAIALLLAFMRDPGKSWEGHPAKGFGCASETRDVLLQRALVALLGKSWESVGGFRSNG